jgi:hypothetical protein
MRRSTIFLFVAITCSAIDTGIADEPKRSQVPAPAKPVYSSPQAVFDAFRQAARKEDWQTVYNCHTPEGRADLVFEAYFACGVKEGEKVEALLKKHRATESEFNALYAQRLQKEQGADGAKATKDGAKMPPEPQTSQADSKSVQKVADPAATVPGGKAPDVPSRDREWVVELVNSLIEDKPGFYADVSALFANSDNPSNLGPLQDVVITGAKATGRASTFVYGIKSEAGRPNQKFAQKLMRDFRFKKTASGWLMEP